MFTVLHWAFKELKETTSHWLVYKMCDLYICKPEKSTTIYDVKICHPEPTNHTQRSLLCPC